MIAAGGITDARGIAAAFALGAAGVQIGTAYLWCPEAKISAPHRAALKSARDDGTALTNLMTGRPARGFINRVMREIGPVSDVAPEFPLAAGALAPLRAKAEAQGSGDFSPMWAGQAASLGRAMPAGELTKTLAAEALERLRALGGVESVNNTTPRVIRRRVPQGSAVSMPAAVAASCVPAWVRPGLGRVEGGGIGGFEREPGQSRAVLVALAGPGAVPDIAGDVMVVAPRRHEGGAVAAGA